MKTVVRPILSLLIGLIGIGVWFPRPAATYALDDLKVPQEPGALEPKLGGMTALYLPLVVNNFGFDSAERLTTDPANDTQPALAPDGQSVVFLSDRAGQPDVYKLTLANRAVVTLTQTPASADDTPVFSPDGGTVAFASNESGDWDIYLMDADGSNKRLGVGGSGTDELHPSFSPDGQTLFFSSSAGGNWDIYSAPLSGGAWTRLTTDPAIDRFPTVSADGAAVVFRGERDGNSEIYAMGTDGTNQRRLTTDPAFDGYPTLSLDGSGVAFASQRSGLVNVYGMNLAGAGVTPLTQLSGWQFDTPRLSPDGNWLVYAAAPQGGTFDIYRKAYTSPLYAVAQRGAQTAQAQCDWEAGVLAYGWLHAWQATGQASYLNWARDWIDGCIPLKTGNINHVNDGLLGYAALTVYQAEGGAERLAFAQSVADYLTNTATRTADGVLTHEGDTVWVDTMLGTVPFLLKMNEVTGLPTYADDALAQVIGHAAHLQDPVAGLYHHAWDESDNSFLGPAYWGRGNGWAMLGEVTALSAMTPTHPLSVTILGIFQTQAAALLPSQSVSGLWPTVVTRPDFYLESSATALIGAAFQRGAAAGWLDPATYGSAGQAALLGVWSQTQADGTVGGVSAPTGPMPADENYATIPYGALELYGQGAALWLASPVEQPEIASPLLTPPLPKSFFFGRGGWGGEGGNPPQDSYAHYIPLVTNRYRPQAPMLGVSIEDYTVEHGLEYALGLNVHFLPRWQPISWKDVEPVEGEYHWELLAGLEGDLMQAHEANVEPVLSIQFTPEWAQQVVPYACGPIRDDKFEAFAAFMEQLVLRYGSSTPYNARYWHLGNEMDVAPGEIGPDSFFGCWGDTADPYYGGEHYGEMLKVVHPRMKAADPQAQVMMGGLLLECDPYTSVVGVDCINQNRWQSGYFLDGVMRAGGGDYFDIFDLHSYAVTDTVPAQMRGYYAWSDSGSGTDLPERVAFVRQVMGNYGHGDKPIFAGEVALKCEEPAPECYEVAAAFVPRVYAEAYQLNLLGVNYYSLINEFKYKGLLLPDFTPRPAYWAYKFMSQKLVGAQPVGALTAYPGISGYDFSYADGHHLWLIWSADGTDQTLTLPGDFLRAYDKYGAALTPLGGQLVVGWSPIYMEMQGE